MITLRGKLQRNTVTRPKVADADSSAAIAKRQPAVVDAGEKSSASTNNTEGAEPAAAPASDDTATKSSSDQIETVEEWKWEGVWAFGTLPDSEEEMKKLLNPPPISFDAPDMKIEAASTTTTPAANDAEMKSDVKEEEKVANDDVVPTAPSQSATPNQSPNWIQKLSSIITGGERSKSEDSTTTTTPPPPQSQTNESSSSTTTATVTKQKPSTTKKRGRGRPPKSSYTPAEAAAMAAREAAKKEAEERERSRPRPFVYKWVEVVKAGDMIVPSSLVVLGVEKEDVDDEKKKSKVEVDTKESKVADSGDNSEKKSDDEKVKSNDAQEKQAASKSEEGEKDGGGDVVMKDAETPKSKANDDTKLTKDESTTTPAATDTEIKPKKQPKGITYAEPPYTDATTTNPPNTCPTSGKWEGHFENVSLKKGKPPRVSEVFYLFFNGTPSPNAHDAFVQGDLTMKANSMLDNDSSTDVSGDDEKSPKKKKKENTTKHLLKEGCLHVRGHGTNRFGTFEIVGSFNPTTGILQCQRMYVPVKEEKNASKKRGRRSRSEAARLLAESVDAGDVERGSGRKRKTSWKTRSKDMSSFGDDTASTAAATALGNSRKTEVASIVKKRSRLSSEGGGGGGGGSNSAGNKATTTSGGKTPLPQCRGEEGGSKLKINMSALKNSSASKPAPSPATTSGGSKKKGKKKAPPASFQGAFPGTVVPIAPVPTLPTEGDPFLARWRAAHYLYYQRIEHNPDDDGPSWGLPMNPSPGQHSVTVKSVVYEGEMHDGVREGRGLCLYNNNLMYEGGWKRNKEHGKGTLMSPDRSRIIYEGDWEKGRMQGQGTYYYYDALDNKKESSKYTGEFKENLRHGLGIYTLPDGSVYDGEWRENNPSGWGLFRWPDGSEYQGPWKDGKRNGTNGILVAADGFRYEGAWANNAMEGIGVATYPNGQIYEGKWVGGRREGRGTIRFTNGAVYEGRFKDDYMEGQGTMKMNENVIIARHKEEAKDNNDDTDNKEETEKNDWMIPLQFQSDISHIHQKAGFTQVGL